MFGEAGYLGLDEAVKSQLRDKFDDMEVIGIFKLSVSLNFVRIKSSDIRYR